MRRTRRWATGKTDQRAEQLLGALAVAVLAAIGAMVVTVLIKAWPSFSHNGLSWFGPGGDVDTQLRAMADGKPLAGHSLYYFRGWPLIWGTLLTTLAAVLIALVVSMLAAVFLTEFAPRPVRRVLEPVVRLLAGVPSVDLRADRDSRARAVHRQAPDQQRAQGVGRATSFSSTATTSRPRR